MKKLPDVRDKAQAHLNRVKFLLEHASDHQVMMHALVAGFEGEEIIVTLECHNEYEKILVFEKLKKYAISNNAMCVIVYGTGHCTLSSLGPDPVKFVFMVLYTPGYEPWTMIQAYDIVEGEVVWLNSTNSHETEINVDIIVPHIWE